MVKAKAEISDEDKINQIRVYRYQYGSDITSQAYREVEESDRRVKELTGKTLLGYKKSQLLELACSKEITDHLAAQNKRINIPNLVHFLYDRPDIT